MPDGSGFLESNYALRMSKGPPCFRNLRVVLGAAKLFKRGREELRDVRATRTSRLPEQATNLGPGFQMCLLLVCFHCLFGWLHVCLFVCLVG